MNIRFFDTIVYVTVCLALTFYVVYLALDPPATGVAVETPVAKLIPLAHNVDNPLDVTGDGVVASNDAQIVMEKLRIYRHALPLPVEKLDDPAPFVDVDGDGYLSEKDAQAIILHLNRISATSRRPA